MQGQFVPQDLVFAGVGKKEFDQVRHGRVLGVGVDELGSVLKYGEVKLMSHRRSNNGLWK
jgi:hypothetical protein